MSRLQLSNACSKYGASMGRDSTSGRDLRMIDGYPVKLRLQRVYVNGQGYDSGGAYWGIGEPLYQASGAVELATETVDVVLYLRATSRDHAKSLVRAALRAATFYR